MKSDYLQIKTILHSYIVVVADSEPGIRDVMCFALMLVNLKVLSANNGKVAYEFTRVSLPDLVLLDIRMSKIDGYETCRLIKESSELRHIPVVLIPTKGQEFELQQGLEAGAVEYIIKSALPDYLASKIRAVLLSSRLGVYEK